jgi:hypothetical protein
MSGRDPRLVLALAFMALLAGVVAVVVVAFLTHSVVG